jgi:uncharacterized protein with PhoU and TrkA domain
MADIARNPELVGSQDAYELCIYPSTHIIVTTNLDSTLIAINAADRQGPLLDISRTLMSFGIQLHHTEAVVITGRSISVWRCELEESNHTLLEIRDSLYDVIQRGGNMNNNKKSTSRIVHAVVIPGSGLAGRRARDVDFQGLYGASLISLQRQGRSKAHVLSKLKLAIGDKLIFSVNSNLQLLHPPTSSDDNGKKDRSLSSNQFDEVFGKNRNGYSSSARICNDLRVVTEEEHVLMCGKQSVEHEFLAAMIVTDKSALIGTTAAHHVFHKMPGMHLISIERPTYVSGKANDSGQKYQHVSAGGSALMDMLSDMESTKGNKRSTQYRAVEVTDKLEAGDILWFSGSASSIGDLRKIPGLKSAEYKEIGKLNEKPTAWHMYQAIVAQQGPLVGKTVKEVKFCTQYGAAVVAVHCNGKHVQSFPGNIKLQAGDILLLKAGSSFICNNFDNNKSFLLFVEVKDLDPPCICMLAPALLITLIMLLLSGTEELDLVEAALVAAVVMVLIGILSKQEVQAAVKWDVIISIAGAFGISTAWATLVQQNRLAPGSLTLAEAFTWEMLASLVLSIFQHS